MDLSFAYPIPVVILAIAASLGLAYWVYRNTVPALTRGKRIALAALRTSALGLILFLLAQPLLRRIQTASEAPVVAVLVDTSRSLDLASDGEGAAMARQAVDQVRGASSDADVRVFDFASSLQEIEPERSLDSLLFDGGRTDITSALQRLLELTANSPLAGVVLVSDGRFNTGQDPIHLADRFPVPIYSVAIGDTVRPRDLQVRRLLTNEIAYKGTEIPLEVGISHAGFPGQSVSVFLTSGGVTLDRRQIRLPQIEGETSVTLTARPDSAGLVRYTVSVTRLEGERTFENNRSSISVRVLESQRKVLLLAGAPSPDLAALRSMVGANPDLSVTGHTQKPDGTFYEGPFTDLGEYDLIVMQGFPSRATRPGTLDQVSNAARAGTPLLFILDRSTDQRAVVGLSDILPAIPRSIRPTFAEAEFTPTAIGARHPVLELPPGIPGSPWSLLPPVYASESQWAPTAGAAVLAVPSIRGITLDDPILATRRIGNARSASVLAHGLWRWLNLPQDLDSVREAPGAFLGQLIRWLVAPEDDRPVRIRSTRATYEGGERVSFQGQVYDEALNPVSNAAVTVTVRSQDGSELPITLRSIGNGRYRGDLGSQAEGDYSYRVEATRGAMAIGEDAGRFSIGPLALEARDTYADIPLMRQLALRSGGRTLSPSGTAEVFQDLDDRGRMQPRERVVEARVRLWDRYPFLIVILLLLTAEWLIRKRAGLV